jgi:hypothetical protein
LDLCHALRGPLDVDVAMGEVLQSVTPHFSWLLMLKFGPMTSEEVARVEHGSADQLDMLAERLITMSTLDEAFGR